MTSDPIEYLVEKDARVSAYWRAFCEVQRLPESTDYQAWHFGDTAELAHELVELVVHGDKRATAGLHWAHERSPSLAPVLGGYNVLTELDGAPRAITRTTRIELRAFKDVDAEFAYTEGEGDRTLATWRKDHWDYFTEECRRLGVTPSQDMLIVLEHFELLHPVG